MYRLIVFAVLLGSSFASAGSIKKATVGDQDLNPMGEMTPSGGMIMGPNHPLFQVPHPLDIRIGDGTLPQGAVPTGARFDPISPFAPQPPSRFTPQQPRFASGEPNNNELLPPDFN